MASIRLRIRGGGGALPAAPTITGTPDTTATVGQPYSWTPTLTGPATPLVVSNVGDTLPAGWSLNSATGEVSNSGPAAAGTVSNIALRVTDALSRTADLAAYSITVAEAGTSLPTAMTVPLSAPTYAGYGARGIGYDGDLWLAVYSQDGVVVTGTYASTDASSDKFRMTRENELVFRGACTFAGVTPSGINNSHTLVIREYPTEADADARTNWTGQQQTTTVLCKGTFTITETAVMCADGSIKLIPAHDINLTDTFCIAPWPRTVTSARYPSGYTTTNEVLLESATNFQLNRAPLAYGKTVMRRPAEFNPPYNDGVHDGTVDLNISCFLTATGTFLPGTDDELAGANFVTIVDEDAPNTHWGMINIYLKGVRFKGCNWDARRPTLDRGNFGPYADASSTQGALKMVTTSNDFSHHYIKVEDCAFGPRGITHAAGMCGLIIITTNDATTAPRGIVIVDSHFSTGYDCINVQKSMFQTPVLPGYGLVIRRNRSTSAYSNDCLKITSYTFTIEDNNFVWGTKGSGAHPDIGQFQLTQMPAGDTLPIVIRGNTIWKPSDATDDGTGQVWNITSGANYDGDMVYVADAEITDNYMICTYAYAIILPAAKRALIKNNTIVRNALQVGDAPGDSQIILGDACSDCTVINNITPKATDLGGGSGNVASNNLVSTVSTVGANALTNVFTNVDYGTSQATPDDVRASWSAKPGGPADGTGVGGVQIGKWDPSGELAAA